MSDLNRINKALQDLTNSTTYPNFSYLKVEVYNEIADLFKDFIVREASLANVIHNFLSVTNFDSSSAPIEDTRKYARATLNSLSIEGENND